MMKTRVCVEQMKKHLDGLLLVRAAGSFDRDAGQSGGPAEQVGAVWSLLDELWYSLNERIDTAHS